MRLGGCAAIENSFGPIPSIRVGQGMRARRTRAGAVFFAALLMVSLIAALGPGSAGRDAAPGSRGPSPDSEATAASVSAPASVAAPRDGMAHGPLSPVGSPARGPDPPVPLSYNTTVGTSPTGLMIMVDGVPFTSPIVLVCDSGSTHELTAPTPQGGPSYRYVFLEWLDGVVTNARTVVCDRNATYVAVYGLQYPVTFDTMPSGLDLIVAGSPVTAPVSLWCNDGESVSATAVSPQIGGSTRYTFDHWSDGSTLPTLTFLCSASADFTAFFTRAFVLDFTANAPGIAIVVDGTSYVTPFTFPCDEGTQHTLEAPLIVGIATGNRVVFQMWSDGVLTANRTIVCTAPQSFLVLFMQQFALTIDAFPPRLIGTVGGASHPLPFVMWCDAGDVIAVSVPSPQGNTSTRAVFASWSDGGAISHVIVCDAPKNLTATFSVERSITLTTIPAGLTVTWDGAPAGTPYSIWCAAGSPHTLSVPSPQVQGDVRHGFVSWSDGGASVHGIVCDSPQTFTAEFLTEYRAVLSASFSNAAILLDGVSYPAPVEVWWTPGSTHIVGVASPQYREAGTRYVFATWSDQGAPGHSVTVQAPMALVASFRMQFFLSVVSAFGSPACDTGDCWYDSGATARVSMSSAEVAVDGTRYRFAGWAGYAAGAGSASVLMNGPATATALWETEGAGGTGLSLAQGLGIGGALAATWVGGAFAISEPARVGLFTLLSVLAVRARREDVLDNENRGMIRGYLAGNPGANFASIRDDLKLATGTLAYHLHVLEREGVIRSWRDGQLKRFALSDHPIANIEPRLTDVELILLQNLRNRPGQTQRDLGGGAGLSQPTVSYHMAKMSAMGFVRAERVGLRKRYFPSTSTRRAPLASDSGAVSGTERGD